VPCVFVPVFKIRHLGGVLKIEYQPVLAMSYSPLAPDLAPDLAPYLVQPPIGGIMGMQIIPGNDRNEAMTLPFATGRRTGGPSPATAIPVHHFAPERRGLAERYQSNPE
jgi:hypothetical protein